MASTIPIQDLDTSSTPPADRSIRAVVTLSWPYSSSTRQCALLLADPDFRLRSRKGQVRVVFRGAAARAVAERRLGIGDAVILGLDGGKWINEVATVQTPGKSVGELEFGGAVKFKLTREGKEDEEVRVQPDVINLEDERREKAPEATPAKRPSAIENFRASFGNAPEKSIGVYSSPAFFRKSRFSELEGLDRLFGEDLDAQGSPKKRARVSIGEVRDWRVVSRTPSPVKPASKPFTPPVAQDGGAMEVEEERAEASDEPSSSPTPAAAHQPRVIDFGSQANTQHEPVFEKFTPDPEPVPDSQALAINPLEQLANSALETQKSPFRLPMAPPSWPRLQMPLTSPSLERGEAAETDGPLTPRLQPISSAALPLPSPFPTETATSVHFPSRGIPDTYAEDDIEVVATRHTGLSRDRQISDTYEDDVIVPSSPRRVEPAKSGDGLDQMDDTGIDHAYTDENLHEEDDEDSSMQMDDVEEEIDPGDLDGSEPSSFDEVGEYANTTGFGSQEEEEESLQPSWQPIELNESEDERVEDRASTAPEIMSASQLLSAQLNAGEVEVLMEPASHTPAAEARLPRLPSGSPAKNVARASRSLFEPVESPSPTARPEPEALIVSTPQRPKITSSRKAQSSPIRTVAPALENPAEVLGPPFESGWERPPAETPVVKSREAAQATPQSERDRALKGTFRSLFGFQPSPSPTKDVPLGFAQDDETAEKAVPQLDGAMPDLQASAAGEEPPIALPVKAEKPVFDPMQQSPSRNLRSSVHVIDLGFSSGIEEDDEPPLQPEQPSNELMAVSPAVAALEDHPTPRLDIEAVIGTPIPETASLDPFILVGPEEQRRRSEHAVLDDGIIAARERSRLASPLFSRDDADAVLEEAYGPTSPGQYSNVPVLLPDDGDSVVSTPFLSQGGNTPRAPIELDDDEDAGSDAEQATPSQPQSAQEAQLQTTDQHPILAPSSFRMLSSSPASAPVAESAIVPASQQQQRASEDIEMLDMSQAEPDHWNQASQSQYVVQPSQQSQPIAVDDSVDSPHTSLFATGSRPEPRDTIEDFDLTQASQISRASVREALDPRVSYMGQRQTFAPSQEDSQLGSVVESQATPQRRRTTGTASVSQALPDLSALTGSVSSAQQEKHDNGMNTRSQRRRDETDAVKAEAARQEAARAEAAKADTIRNWVASAEANTPQVEVETYIDKQADAPAADQTDVALPLLRQSTSSLHSKDDVLKRLFGIGTASQSVASDGEAEHESLGGSQAEVSYPRLPITPSFSQSQSARFETQLPDPEAISGDVPAVLPITPQLTQRESDLQAMVSTQEAGVVESRPNQSTIEQIATTTTTTTTTTDEMAKEKQDPPLAIQQMVQAETQNRIEQLRILQAESDLSQTDHVDVAPSEKVPLPETPRRKSLRSRLSNVPDVISAWFSPKRSSAVASIAEEQVNNEKEHSVSASPVRQRSNGVNTAHAYFTRLASLERHLNPRNSQSYGSQSGVIDVLAVVTDHTKGPQRAKGGPRDYFTVFHITDRSLPALTNISVEVYRPWKAVLPAADVGDVVLLRSFAVKSRHRKPYLLSTDASAWCVWRFAERAETGEAVKESPRRRRSSDSGAREEVKGPPIEYGEGEREQAKEMRSWWVHLENTVLATSGADTKEAAKV